MSRIRSQAWCICGIADNKNFRYYIYLLVLLYCLLFPSPPLLKFIIRKGGTQGLRPPDNIINQSSSHPVLNLAEGHGVGNWPNLGPTPFGGGITSSPLGMGMFNVRLYMWSSAMHCPAPHLKVNHGVGVHPTPPWGVILYTRVPVCQVFQGLQPKGSPPDSPGRRPIGGGTVIIHLVHYLQLFMA